MKRSIYLLASFLVLMFAIALAQKPPSDILILLQKMRNGAPLTTDEQAKVRAWQQQRQYQAGGGQGEASGAVGTGGMPPDVAAVMEKVQRGVPPSPAEIELLKTWGDKMKSAKGAILKNEKETSAILRGASPGPSGIQVKSPFVDGDVRIEQTLVTTHPESCHSSKVMLTESMTTRMTASVRFKTREPGKPLSQVAAGPESGPFSLIFEPLGVGNFSINSSNIGCDHKSGSQGGQSSLSGELNVDPRRVFISLTGPVTTLDTMRSDVSWQHTIALSADLKKSYGEQVTQAESQIPGYMKSAIAHATFTMAGDDIRKALRQAGPAFLSGVYSYQFTNSDASDGPVTVQASIHVIVRLRPTADAKMHMAVLDENDRESTAAWQKWMPLPWLDSDEESKFFGLAKRHDAKASLKVRFSVDDNKPCKFHVELSKVNERRGVTTNWPVKAKDSRKTMKIFKLNDEEPKVNFGWQVASDGQSADTISEVTSAVLQISSLDTAASAEVRARCEAYSLDATFEPTGKTVLVLPRDDNDNHVADQYEEDTKATGRNLPSLWDEDEQPAEQRRKGDGYTLFEEYRGFVVRTNSKDATRKFVRTAWNRKTGFWNDPDELADKYVKPSNRFEFEWFSLDDKLAVLNGGENDPEYRMVNSNTPADPAYRYAAQYLVIFKKDDSLAFNAQAVPRSGANPAEVTFVHPMRTYAYVVVNEARAQTAFTAASLPKCSGPQLAQIQYNDTAGSVIHELGHHLGVHHHLFHPPDIYKPKRDAQGKVDWKEDDLEQRYGVNECVMRYNDRYGPKAWGDDYDARPLKQQCLRPLYGFCRAGDIGSYPAERHVQRRTGRVTERTMVQTPSDNCWGQIDIKNDPN